jgi:hypothetical protein
MKIFELETIEQLHKATKQYRTPAIYLVKCNEYYKIGRSNSILDRIRVMEIGNPYKLELVFFARTDKDLEVEKMLHKTFEHKRIKGEWFCLSDSDIMEFERIIKKTWTKKDANI